MLRRLVDARVLIALAIAAGVGTVGLRAFPMRSDHVFLAVIEARRPDVYYAPCPTATPVSGSPRRSGSRRSSASLVDHRRLPRRANGPLPQAAAVSAARDADQRRRLCWAKRTIATRPGRAPQPTWLTIPQRGLYTGRDDPRRSRHREDVRLHVSLRGPAPALACATTPTARSADW